MFETLEITNIFEDYKQTIIYALEQLNDGYTNETISIIENIKNEIIDKNNALINKSEHILNEYYVFRSYIDFLIEYCKIWKLLKIYKFSESWDILQNTMDILRILKKFTNHKKEKQICFFENQLINLEKLYPYDVFVSIGAMVDYFECSICGQDIDSMDCPHLKGELYNGVMAIAVAKNLVSLDHVALVKHPIDKRCVIQYEDSSEHFRIIRYLAELINEKKFKPFYFGELKFSTKVVINTDYKTIGRNKKCFCGSGKKFKQCCIEKKTIESEHIDIVGKPINIRKLFNDSM